MTEKKKTDVLINFEELKIKINFKNYEYKDFMRVVNKISDVVNCENKENE